MILLRRLLRQTIVTVFNLKAEFPSGKRGTQLSVVLDRRGESRSSE